MYTTLNTSAEESVFCCGFLALQIRLSPSSLTPTPTPPCTVVEQPRFINCILGKHSYGQSWSVSVNECLKELGIQRALVWWFRGRTRGAGFLLSLRNSNHSANRLFGILWVALCPYVCLCLDKLYNGLALSLFIMIVE